MANPRPTPKPENFGLPWPLPARRDNPAGYSRGRPVRGLKMIVGWFGIPWGWRRQPMNWRPIRGWTKPLHECGMKADSMPERLLIGPGSSPSIDPVYPELSPPLEPCPNPSEKLRRKSRPIEAMTRSTLMPSSRMRSSTAARTLLSYSARGSTPGGVCGMLCSSGNGPGTRRR